MKIKINETVHLKKKSMGKEGRDSSNEIKLTLSYAANKNSIGLVPKLTACPRNGIDEGMWGGILPLFCGQKFFTWSL